MTVSKRQAGASRQVEIDSAVPSEMEIVDTFTHLIFSGGDMLSAREMSIVDVLCRIDENAALCPTGEIGVYLRELGVREMIGLVGRVRRQYPELARTESPDGPGQPAQA